MSRLIKIVARPIIRSASARKPIGLALQGGGSWGAFTWDVLDALLASRSIRITQLSGTSAGAINAAIVASALANGSPAQARKALRSFWLSIAAPDAPEVVRSFLGPLERHCRNSMNDRLLASGLMSPYRATTLGVHPLREAIAAHVDIDAIRSKSAAALFVTVTNVKTGLPRVISNRDMSIEPAKSTRSTTRRTNRGSSPDQIAPYVIRNETRCTCNGRRAPCNSHATVLAHIERVRSKE